MHYQQWWAKFGIKQVLDQKCSYRISESWLSSELATCSLVKLWFSVSQVESFPPNLDLQMLESHFGGLFGYDYLCMLWILRVQSMSNCLVITLPIQSRSSMRCVRIFVNGSIRICNQSSLNLSIRETILKFLWWPFSLHPLLINCQEILGIQISIQAFQVYFFTLTHACHFAKNNQVVEF